MFNSMLLPFGWNLFFGKGFADESEGGISEDSETPDNSTPSEQGDVPSETEGEPQEPLTEEPAKDRPAENYAAENKRKTERIEALQRELQDLKVRVETSAKPEPETQVDTLESAYSEESTRKAIERLKNKWSVDDDFIRDIMAISGHQAGFVSSRNLSPYAQRFAEQDLNDVVSELSEEEGNKFVIEKYKNEIKQTLVAEKVNPKMWGNKAIIKMILGNITMKHLPEINKSATTKRIDRDVMQEGRSPATTGLPSGITAKELSDYANDIGLDITSPTIKKKALEGLAAKKRALKAEN